MVFNRELTPGEDDSTYEQNGMGSHNQLIPDLMSYS